jgi:hypothetical protein
VSKRENGSGGAFALSNIALRLFCGLRQPLGADSVLSLRRYFAYLIAGASAN